MDTRSDPLGSADFGLLPHWGDYASYFGTLQRCCTRLVDAYLAAGVVNRATAEGRFEAVALTGLTQKLIASLSALRVRHSHERDGERPPYIDLSDSGFPNFHEISKLESDLELAPERRVQLPALPALKRKLLDRIMRGEAHPEEELSLMSERSYFDTITKAAQFFLTFSPGTLEFLGYDGDRRSYGYSWGSYDPMVNQPSIYTLFFEQKAEAPRIESSTSFREQFIDKIQIEGSRAVPIVLMAVGIDEFQGVYPKILKRFTFGPLFTPLILSARQDALSRREQAIEALFGAVAGEESFIHFALSESAVSEREEPVDTLSASLGFAKDKKQIFRLPPEDIELSKRKASDLRRFALLPHQLLQLMTPDIRALVPELCGGATLFPFDQKGEISYVSRSIPERNTD